MLFSKLLKRRNFTQKNEENDDKLVHIPALRSLCTKINLLNKRVSLL